MMEIAESENKLVNEFLSDIQSDQLNNRFAKGLDILT